MHNMFRRSSPPPPANPAAQHRWSPAATTSTPQLPAVSTASSTPTGSPSSTANNKNKSNVYDSMVNSNNSPTSNKNAGTGGPTPTTSSTTSVAALADENRVAMMRRIRETEVCPICQEGDCTQAMLCCGACYHFDCLLSWIRVNSNCPQCRKEIPNTVLYREMQLLEASGPEDLPEGREALQDMQNRARRTRAPVVVHGGAGGGDPFSPFIGGGGGISLLAPIEIGGGSVGNPGYIMGGGPDVGGVVLPTPGGPRHNLMTGRHPHSSLMQHMFEMMASPSGGMFGPGGLGGGGPRHELVIVTSHGDELNPGGLAGGNEGGPRNNGNNSPSGGGGGRDVGRTSTGSNGNSPLIRNTPPSGPGGGAGAGGPRNSSSVTMNGNGAGAATSPAARNSGAPRTGGQSASRR
mmetsp:Transcript_3126/g.7270  ORF Transcript_3126/g.7270 Transcript_3126/m.7270 type:complete len:406 (-) Transcript_3126:463-1680(-)